MAFDLKKYIENFKNIEKTPEGIREAASAILANADKLQRVFSNTSLVSWANQALSILEGGGKGKTGTDPETMQFNADEAYRWLSGSAQSNKAKNMRQRAEKNRQEAQKKIADFATNAANILDIPADASPEERAKLEKKAKEYQEDMQQWIGIGDILGIDTKAAQSLVRTASGYIPASEVATQGVPGGPAATPVGESATSTIQTSAPISFRDGLTEIQKKGLTDLSQKPTSQWTETDKANWAYGTNNSPIPSAMSSVGGTGGATSTIPFRQGLSDFQKEGLTNLSKKPIDQWTATDRENWAYGTDGSPVPTGTTGSSSGSTSGGVSGSDLFSSGGGAGTTGGTSSTSVLDGDLPPEIQAMLEGLSPEQQEVIRITYNGLISGDEAARADANKALEDAIGLADPYFKQLIRSAQDELQRGVASTKETAASQIGTLQSRINQLNEDLTYNRDQLSLDQQAALASQLRQYKQDLSGLQTQFQEAGLTFSSPRAQAEQQLSEQQRAVAESTNRQTARALRSLETGTLRDIQGTTTQIGDVSRNAAESVVDMMRRGEQTLGTSNLPTDSGVTPLGGVTGSINEQRQNAILGLEDTLLKRTAPTDHFATT